VATSTTKLDPRAVHEQLLDVVRGLLAELGNSRGEQTACRDSHLERDLGLGSLERVELLLRLERALGVRLPDRVMAQAETLADVASALLSGDFAAALGTDRAAPISVSPQSQSGAAAKTLAPEFETLQQALAHRGRADATRAHLVFWSDASSESSGAAGTTLTFGALYEGAHRFAVELAHRGISPGDVVSLMLPTSPEFFFAFAGTLLAGAIPAPIYPPIRADRIEEYAERQGAILSNAQAKLLVTFREGAGVARLLRPRVQSLDGVVTAAQLLAARNSDLPLPGLGHGDDVALLQYTSGSTGDPKGVTLSHSNLLANIRALGEALEVRQNDVGVSWLPLYHDMGLIGAWLGPLCFGIPVVMMSPLEFLTRPERWLWAVHRHRGTLSAAPNFAYELCVRKTNERDLHGLDLSSWRAALNGAEPVLPETLDRFAERFARYGFRREALTPVYGLAEASLGVTFPPIGRGPRVDRIDRETLAQTGLAVPSAAQNAKRGDQSDDSESASFVSVGGAVSSCEVRIVVDAGDKIAGEPGCEAEERREGQLWFRGSSATRGYYRNADATARLFPLGAAAGWINSGDRAYRADGEYYITGRTKDIIVKAGRNLYPHEIEEAVARVAGVRRGCVVAFGAADASTGSERLVVVAESRERSSEARGKLAAAITEQIARVVGVPPNVVLTVPPHSIPKTSSGKLRRDRTKQLYEAGVCGTPSSPPWLQVARLALKSFARTVARIARIVPEKIYGVYAGLVFGAIMVPAWLIVLPVRNRRFVAGVAVGGLRLCFLLIGSPIRVSGREHLATPGRVLVSNHASYMDVLVLMAGLGTNFHIVSKSEVRKMPIIGTFLHKLDHFWFDRGDAQARLRQAEQIEQALRHGESVYVFPEGTFTPQIGVRPFQLGAFQAAARAGSAVVPIALRGTRHFLRDDTYLPRPTRLEIHVGAPIEPQPAEEEGSWREIVRLRDASRDWIAREAGEPLL
jgi:1-acyl-sn-glycerol-3-phosphate acyltransferase